MFKCKECGQEFSIRPDYCDCGNDTFDEVVSADFDTVETIVFSQNAVNSSRMDLATFLRRRNISVFSLSIFVCCLILSFVVLVFCFNLKTTQVPSSATNKSENKITNIPNIDALWDDSPIQVVQPKLVKKVQNFQSGNVVNNVQQPVKTLVNKSQVATKKTTPSVVTRTASTSKKTTTSNSTKSTVKTSPVVSSKSTPTTTQKSTPKSTPKSTTAIKTTQQKVVTNQQVSATPIPKKTTPVYSAELNSYKVALRSALFSKLSVVSIQGKGTCGIEFSIDSSGKLINRAFTYQSDNKSVNDEVYKMLMRLPSFYAPPAAYKGEKIKMTFSFNNGSYVINYTN